MSPGSMSHPHHVDDAGRALRLPKKEAIRFVDKRPHDAIGLVIFGNQALTRCPLTVDKRMLKDSIAHVDIGIVDHNGTVLAQAVVAAANRLKDSKAKSKIIILLTHGAPSENDLDPRIALEVAKRLGIKIYTIGIGGDDPVYINHPFYGRIPIAATLDQAIADAAGARDGWHVFRGKKGA